LCSQADACAAGFQCVDGFCCNSACTGQCEACDVEAGEGTCVPISGEPHGDRVACPEAASDDPCAAATCDGEERTMCAGFVGSSVSCRDASCEDGVATLAATCDGKGSCAEDTPLPCAPYACDATKCKTSCASDADCEAGGHCDASTNKCVAGLTCDGDHTVTGANGVAEDCTPYKCDATGCLTTCRAVTDCVAPTVCDATGHCAQPPSAVEEEGGCAVAPGRRDGGASWWLAFIAAAAAVGLKNPSGRRLRERGR